MAELQKAQKRRRRNTRVIPAIVVVVVLAVIGVFLTSSGGSGHKKKVTTATSVTSTTAAGAAPTAAPVTGGTKITGPTPCPSFTGSNPHVTEFAQPPPDCLAAGKSYTATIATTMGDVVVSFDTTKTPKTADNFIVLSLYHYYEDTALFRTDTSIGIIQGGSPHTQSASDPGPGYTIPDEGSGFTYSPGDLVMARTGAPNSAGAQFFFCVTSACSNLDSQGTYVKFAHVTSGLDVLQKILALNVNQPGGLGGAPSKLVLIKSISVNQS